MGLFKTFIFGLVNFAILVGVLIWFSKKLARQYFYARQTGIKKKITDSTLAMRSAQKRSAVAHGLVKNFDSDIEKRRATALAICKSECRVIEENTRRAAAYIIDGAKRQGERARARELLNVRNKIIEDAFKNAAQILKGKLAGDMGGTTAKKELEAFEKNIGELKTQ